MSDRKFWATSWTPTGGCTRSPPSTAKLLVVLDFLAQRFEPGQKYPEARVNEILGEFHPDYAALRRYLVENGFLDRADQDSNWVYWRSGGTVDV